MQTVHTGSGLALCDAGFVQRREWMLYEIRPDQYPFNVGSYFELPSYDEAIIRQVLYLMIERHEILRTTLQVIDGKLKQVIHPAGDFQVDYDYHDLRNMPEEEKDRFMQRTISSQYGIPFDFRSGPLFRLLIFHRDTNLAAVQFVFHHLISDLHSGEIFSNDIVALYRIVAQNSPSILQAPPVQYREYAHFENELLETGIGERYRKYWEKVLVNGIPGLAVIRKSSNREYNAFYRAKLKEVHKRLGRLTCSDNRFLASVVRRYRVESAGELIYRYGAALFDRLKVYQAEGRNGLLALVTGSLLLAFRKLCGQTFFAFEIPASRRVNSHFAQTLGWLTSQGPCYFDISDKLHPRKLLDYIDEQLYQLSVYCVYPFEVVGYKSKYPPGSRMPVFLTLSYSQYDYSGGGNGIVFKRTAGSGTYQDIAFFFTAYNNALVVDIIYNNILFEPETVETLVSEQITALQHILNYRSGLV